MKLAHRFEIALPDWVDDWLGPRLGGRDTVPGGDAARMSLAVELAAENVLRKTGGPFGALVVQHGSGRLLGVGVNLVTTQGLSVAHAEIVALSLAQRAVASWNLADAGPVQLVSSCEPCAMCFGAVPWAGIGSLVCGARREDAEAAGFDEGDKPDDWTGALTARGIAVGTGVLREDAARVLREYAADAGAIYHPAPR